MKKLHLISNAHIDPIWQWNYYEGIGTAISTFQSAVNLSKEYDYVFCHNEAMLFEEIERLAPDLFKEIQELVKQGKWVIMGGWYLQPDCNLPSGESIVRQILTGKEYFMDKFGASSETACGFDAFGHTRGLVQIIRKCGQKNYLHIRPWASQLSLKDDFYIWKGFDGSEIKGARVDVYGTLLGHVGKKIEEYIEKEKDRPIGIKLWGVGNHGGGPSRKDLEDIKVLAENADFEIVHSNPDAFFEEMQTNFVFEKSLRPSMPGCYVSMSRVKRKHIQCENLLYRTEKICSVAALKDVMEYPVDSIKNAVKSLLLSEFHDALSGCCIEEGEAQVLNHLGKAITLLEREQNNAFYALSLMGEVAKPGEYPLYVFNPHPYDMEAKVECELCLAEQNCTEQVSVLRVLDKDGNELVSQTVKENSNLNIDWRRKIIFEGKLKALDVTRFSVYVTFEDKKEKTQTLSNEIVFDNGEKKVVIDTRNGLLVSYEVNGKQLVNGAAFEPYLYEDNADPWGMDDTQLTALGVNPVAIPLAKSLDGIFEKAQPVSIIEDGNVCLTVQSIFVQKGIKVRLQYIIYKKGVDVDVKADVFFNEKDKIVKLHVPTVFKNSGYYGQTAYGIELLENDGREVPAQRFVYVGEDNEKLSIINNCTYGSAMKDGVVAISLLRGAGYCVHPMLERPLIPDMQYVQRLDQGESNFSFKLTYAPVETLERLATEFNQPPYALNVFPIALKRDVKVDRALEVDNVNVVLACFKKADRQDGYVLRLFNNDSRKTQATVRFKEGSATFTFGEYEVKTVIYNNGVMQEMDEMII